MERELKSLQKGLKADTIFLCVICIIFAAVFLLKVWNIVNYSMKSDSAFEVRLLEEDASSGIKEYWLYVDGEEVCPVDYNKFFRLDYNGNTDYKYNAIIGEVKSMLSCLIIEIIFVLLYQIMAIVKRGKSPFVMKAVMILRVMAVMSILLAVLPPMVEMVVSLTHFTSVTAWSSAINFYVLAVGVVFGILSEIFKYGCMLQSDMDQIA